MSRLSTLLGTPSAAVRTMKPPPLGRISLAMPRRRRRSFSLLIWREMPRCSTVGMKTRCRPGIEMWQVARAPLVSMGSLVTCTRISCPCLSWSSMGGMLFFLRRPEALPASSSSSGISSLAWSW